MNELKIIQDWYSSHCNGDWEHQKCVRINTIDNPGWRIVVNLENTFLEGIKRKPIQIENTEEDWIHINIENSKIKVYCGAMNLIESIKMVALILKEDTEYQASISHVNS